MAITDLDDDACYRATFTRDARFDGRLFGGVKTTGIYCRPICPVLLAKSKAVDSDSINLSSGTAHDRA
jgi:AraC family transcriptional regulator, regulatory protein of adaptative response / DNA-3-methyladenine glycosylase II